MPERATREEKPTPYRALGDVAIQKRIAASFFLSRKFRLMHSLPCEKARSPPLRFDFKKFRSEEKKGDIS